MPSVTSIGSKGAAELRAAREASLVNPREWDGVAPPKSAAEAESYLAYSIAVSVAAKAIAPYVHILDMSMSLEGVVEMLRNIASGGLSSCTEFTVPAGHDSLSGRSYQQAVTDTCATASKSQDRTRFAKQFAKQFAPTS